jgi:hypothetical protein
VIVFTTCRNYTTVATATYDVDAPAECARLEEERGDGYAVVAWQNGRLIADAEGWADDREGAPPYDAATATGMYDRW